MGNNERDIINEICKEQNFEELLLQITSKSNNKKLNKILNDIAIDSRMSDELKKSVYEDFFEYVIELNQSYISSIKDIFCIGAEKALNKMNKKNCGKGSSNMGIKTRIIIADDNAQICRFMQHFLSQHDDIEILGIAHTDEDEIKMIEQLKPEIVITDLVRNHVYSGLAIINDYYKKKSPVKFLVVSADRKQDVINNGLEVAGYIEKSFSFNYEQLYNEIKRIKQEIDIEKYNDWDYKYHKLEYIELYSLFDMDDLKILRKLGIDIKNKKYTEYEYELLVLELGHYMEIKEDDPAVIEALKDTRKYIADKGVSQEEFDKIVKKIDSFKIL